LSHRIGRREFFAAAAGAVAGFRVGAAFAEERATGRLDRIGLHLNTVRDMMKQSVPRTLARVAKAGYKEVELDEHFNTPAVEMRKILDDNGLTSPSAHVQMADIGMMLPGTIDTAAILGQKYLTVTWIDGPDRTAGGYRRVADRFNAAGLIARGNEMQLAYHNSAYEFTPLAGGRTGYEILLRQCDPLNVAMEADVFWLRAAKQDPLAWFAKYPGRFHLLHLKDMGPPPRNEMRDVGEGVMDWKAIVSRSKSAGVKHYLVEREGAKDPLRSIRDSCRFLKALRF